MMNSSTRNTNNDLDYDNGLQSSFTIEEDEVCSDFYPVDINDAPQLYQENDSMKQEQQDIKIVRKKRTKKILTTTMDGEEEHRFGEVWDEELEVGLDREVSEEPSDRDTSIHQWQQNVAKATHSKQRKGDSRKLDSMETPLQFADDLVPEPPLDDMSEGELEERASQVKEVTLTSSGGNQDGDKNTENSSPSKSLSISPGKSRWLVLTASSQDNAKQMRLDQITDRIYAAIAPSAESSPSEYLEYLNVVDLRLKDITDGPIKIFATSAAPKEIDKVFDRIEVVEMKLGSPPELSKFINFCQSFYDWLAEGTNHIALLHCCGDINRLLLLLLAYANFYDQIEKHDIKITLGLKSYINAHCIHMSSLPASFRRYAAYMSRCSLDRLQITKATVNLHAMVLYSFPVMEQSRKAACKLFFKIYTNKPLKTVHTTRVYCLPAVVNRLVILFDNSPVTINNDAMIVCYHKNDKPPSRKRLFKLIFNTCEVTSDLLTFERRDFDEVYDASPLKMKIDLYFRATAAFGQDPREQSFVESDFEETVRIRDSFENLRDSNLYAEKHKLRSQAIRKGISSASKYSGHLDSTSFVHGPMDSRYSARVAALQNSTLPLNNSSSLVIGSTNKENDITPTSAGGLYAGVNSGMVSSSTGERFGEAPRGSSYSIQQHNISTSTNYTTNNAGATSSTRHQSTANPGMSRDSHTTDLDRLLDELRHVGTSAEMTKDGSTHRQLTERERLLVEELMETKKELALQRSRSLSQDPPQLYQQHTLQQNNHGAYEKTRTMPNDTMSSRQRNLSGASQYRNQNSEYRFPVESGDYNQFNVRPLRAHSQTNMTFLSHRSNLEPQGHMMTSDSNINSTGMTRRFQPGYSARREHLKQQQEQQHMGQVHVHQHSTTHHEPQTRGDVVEEIETITLQPIGRGVQDLDPNHGLCSATSNHTLGRAASAIIQDSAFEGNHMNQQRSQSHLVSTNHGIARDVSSLQPQKALTVQTTQETSGHQTMGGFIGSGVSHRDSRDGGVIYRESGVTSYREATMTGATATSHNAGVSPGVISYGLSRTNSVGSSVEMLGGVEHGITLKMVQMTAKVWYQPCVSRDSAISQLRTQTPGNFVVRDSNTFADAFGLAVKVPNLPMNLNSNKKAERNGWERYDQKDLVRHYLIEPVMPKGVRLKGFSNEPVFPNLATLIHQHTLIPLALPCRLVLPGHHSAVSTSSRDQHTANYYESEVQHSMKSGGSLGGGSSCGVLNGASCTVLYLGSREVESSGSNAVKRTIERLLGPGTPVKSTECLLKASSSEGVVLNDTMRKLFVRRVFPTPMLSYAGVDPKNRGFDGQEVMSRGITSARIFGLVTKQQGTGNKKEYTCHLFCELDPSQPATAIVKYISKKVIGSR